MLFLFTQIIIMELQITTITTILFIGFLISGGIVLYSNATGYVKGQGYFTLMMLMASVYTFNGMVESAVTDIESKILWSKLEYLGVAFAALFLLSFVVNFINSPRISIFKHAWPYYIIPVVCLILALTNEYHHLIWTGFEWSNDGENILTYHHGVAFYFLSIYSLILIILSIYVLIKALPGFPVIIQKQTWILIAGCCAPLVMTIMYITGITPFKGLDLSAMSLPITGIVFLVGIFKFGMFKIIPSVSSQITNVIQDGLLVIDENEKILFYNSSASKLFGLGSKNFSYMDIKGISWLQEFTSIINNGLKETELMIQADPEKWLHVNIDQIKNDDGKLKGNLLLFHDITKRKHLEQQSRNLLEELHISNQKMKEANSQKDRIVSIIAHDLRTPFHQITNLSSLTQDLMSDLSKEQVKEYLADINMASEQGSSILEELLTWARSQQTQITSKVDSFNPVESAQLIVDSMSFSLKSKDINVHIEGDPNLNFSTDTNVFNFVTRNLMANAIKFSNQGDTITIKIETGNPYIMVHVTDNGIGIPEADRSKLFNSKVKYSRVGTKGESGSGLGLLLCKEMIERNNGQIDVTSVEGKGSTFSVKFLQNNISAS